MIDSVNRRDRGNGYLSMDAGGACRPGFVVGCPFMGTAMADRGRATSVVRSLSSVVRSRSVFKDDGSAARAAMREKVGGYVRLSSVLRHPSSGLAGFVEEAIKRQDKGIWWMPWH